MKIVLDTNVLIAAFISHGACAELFEHCLTQHALFMSPFILEELKDSLEKKLNFPPEKTHELIEFIKQNAQEVNPVPLNESVCRDPDDDLILGTALAAGADCLITGDDDILSLREFQGIAILKPSDFWRFERDKM